MQPLKKIYYLKQGIDSFPKPSPPTPKPGGQLLCMYSHGCEAAPYYASKFCYLNCNWAPLKISSIFRFKELAGADCPGNASCCEDTGFTTDLEAVEGVWLPRCFWPSSPHCNGPDAALQVQVAKQVFCVYMESRCDPVVFWWTAVPG